MAISLENPCKADFARRSAAFKDHAIVEQHGEFTRRIEFEVGYDHRAFPDACGGGGHGQHGMTVRFVLVGPAGATQWVFNLTEFVPGNYDGFGHVPTRYANLGNAMAYDLGYHWPTERYEGMSSFDCDYLPGGKCFYDGSGLNAGPILEKFLSGGPAVVWAELESYYRELQSDAE